MSYHDELLRQALRLARNERERPRQASLRRAVSAAYYGLFHLLIDEAVRNWKHADARPMLGRAFEHRTMKDACNFVLNRRSGFGAEDPESMTSLTKVAEAFVQLQEQRHIADYDNGRLWTRKQSLASVNLAEQAFANWRMIRHAKIAQVFLVSLLAKRR